MLLYFSDHLVGESRGILTPKHERLFGLSQKMDRFPDDVAGASNHSNSTLAIYDQVKTMFSTLHKY